MIRFLKALAVFAGTIIGVGIFGLPYVALKTGFWPVFFYFFFLAAAAMAVHLMYAKVSLGTKGLYRLPGYVSEYLGSGWKKFSFLIVFLQLTGALLAYLIVGGTFLKFIFSPYFGGGFLIYVLLFFIPAAYLIYRGIKSISKVELTLLFVFFSILLLFFFKAWPLVSFHNLQVVDLSQITLPYGVVLFALWGANIIPELSDMAKGDSRLLRNVIVFGILMAAISYIAFIFIILGACGSATSEEAISGLFSILDGNIIKLGFVFGVITCFTSFLTLALTLKKVFWYDLGLNSKLSWAIACFTPLLLLLAGINEYISVIGITGAITLGICAILIVFIYKSFLKKSFSAKINPLFYIFPLIFLLGILFEVFYFAA